MEQRKRIQVFLSEKQWQMVEEMTEKSGFRTFSDFLRHLIIKEYEKR